MAKNKLKTKKTPSKSPWRNGLVFPPKDYKVKRVLPNSQFRILPR